MIVASEYCDDHLFSIPIRPFLADLSMYNAGVPEDFAFLAASSRDGGITTGGLDCHGDVQYGVIVSSLNRSRFLKVNATVCSGEVNPLALLLARDVDL